ncbi:PIR Superfamily Protein [Plasmodium ovale curtisi]|uniref:PIR Superfamily Protein n=1 Tax=Plasmodium ovale curtisi TaxID=864141 RepID=A0A1A8VW50_PLAOA|nr:PIR Superfamily Protein [Plasmodium ovale curtisi]SBT02223.1 PIR Superfamily Protein [Plasmodium ovale curtisi]
MPGENPKGPNVFSGMHLSTLPSEKFYNDIKKENSDLSDYSHLCDTSNVYNYPNEAKKICEKILRYLHKYPVLKDDNTGYDVCKLLNYWIYDTLAENFGAENTTKIEHAFGSLQMIWSYPNPKLQKTSYYNKCKPDFNIFKEHDWKNIRELYEYYVDYSTLYGLAKSFDDECEYYKKIEAKKTLYEHFGNSCLTNEYKCPQLYDKCQNYNPEKVLSDLPCHGRIAAQRAASAKSLAKAHHLEQSQRHVHRVQPVSHPSSTGLTEQNPDIGRTVGHSVLGVAPVLLTATALYRYTPVGSWFRKLGGYNQSDISDMDGFSSYTQESGDIFADSAANYISYQPI